MSKLITIENGYEIRLGQKNPSCYPCFFEGSVCAEAMERGQIVVCAMHPKAREVFDSLGMSYLMIYPNENERDRYFTIYDTRPDEREWIELNKSTWDTKIDSLRNAKIPTHCFKDEIPTGLNLTEYLEGLNIFDPEDLLNTLLRKIAVEPVPKEVQWWEAQGRFENLIGAEFRKGGGLPSRSSITSAIPQRSMPTPVQMS